MDTVPAPDAPDAPDGFRTLAVPAGRFMAENGPILGRLNGDELRLGLRLDDSHANAGGIAHGGALMTFADTQLCLGAMFRLGEFSDLATINLTVDFVRPGRMGGWLEGETTIVRATRNLVFVEAMLSVDGECALRVSAILRRRQSDSFDPAKFLTDEAIPRRALKGQAEGEGAPGAPAGYRRIAIPGPFLVNNGPLYGALEGDVLRIGLRLEERHANSADVCHGGLLMMLADLQLAAGSMFRTGSFKFMPTVHFSCDLVAAAHPGDWLYGETQVIRQTGNYSFADCLFYIDDEPVMRASSISKLSKKSFDLITPDTLFA
jgi:uncharacterized protein (TIGR00369 family)